MRMAFLPVAMVLAGGMAWGQTPVGATTAPVRLTAQMSAPVLVLQAQPNPSQALILKQEKALTAELQQRGQELARLAAQRNARSQASAPQLIPTQWPHARAELIPTQWPKVTIELVGGGPARPASQSAAQGAGSTVRPR
jgi:hypothetical protein